MELGTLGCYYRIPIVNPEVRRIFDQRNQCSHITGYCISHAPSSFCVSLVAHRRYNQFKKSSCTSSSQEFLRDTYKSPHEDDGTIHLEPEEEDGEEQVEEEVEIVSSLREESMNQNIWNQMKEIMMFSGPAVGLWICGPLMSLIDTAVIGQGSSIELAALGKSIVNILVLWRSFYTLYYLFEVEVLNEQVLERLYAIIQATCSCSFRLQLRIWLLLHWQGRIRRKYNIIYLCYSLLDYPVGC